MVQINFAQKSVNLKLVYYGPGMSGKTTNLEIIHQRAPEGNHGELTSISTDGDRTLFFDYMPLDLGTVAGMRTAFQLYTVPGQVYYNSTRKLVLQGVDGIIFVADSSAAMINQNIESLRNLEENLNEYGKSLSTLPHVIQFNKRDLPDAMPVDEMARVLNPHNAPVFEAIANSGQGVFPTLKALAASVLKNIMNETGAKGSFAGASPAPQAPPMPRAPAARPPAPARPQGGFPQPQAPALPQGVPGMHPGFAQPGQAGGGGFFPGVQPAGPMGTGAPAHGHAPALQLAQPSHGMQSVPLNVAMPAQQARPQQRPNLAVQQPAAQARKAAPAQAARPAQRAPAAPAKAAPRPAAKATKAAEQEKPKGKLTPVFIAVGAGVGAVLAWVLMNVL